MKIQSIWKDNFPKDMIEIRSHPDNKVIVHQLKSRMEQVKTLMVLDEAKNIKVKMNIDNIECIETYAHVSRVYVGNEGRSYVLQRRLKELDYLSKDGMQRINNSTILNLKAIKSFEAISNARLAVTTINNKKYIVSRYYAKEMKEQLK